MKKYVVFYAFVSLPHYTASVFLNHLRSKKGILHFFIKFCVQMCFTATFGSLIKK